MNQSVTTLITPRWILTLDESQNPQGGLLEGHSLVIENNLIKAILPSAQAKTDFANAKHVDLPNQLLMPGFVNCHGHAAMSLFRGMADDLPLMTWLEEHIWPAEGNMLAQSLLPTAPVWPSQKC